MVEKIISYITKHALLKPNSTVIVGLSCGPDSVCLTHVLKQLQPQFNLKLIAAHLDHEWRATSGQDVLFCKELAQSLSIDFIHAKASEIIAQKKYNGSKEELGKSVATFFF